MKELSRIDKIVNFLEDLLRLNKSTEALLIDLVAALSPWCAPFVPAYLTYHNVNALLSFPWYIALASAACVEFLGLSAISTTVQFWAWNEGKLKSDPRAPQFLALLTGAFYLSIVLTVNAILDGGPLVYKIANGLLSSMSVCAGIILALRSGHARRIREAKEAKEERKAERSEKSGKLPETYRQIDPGADYRKLPVEDRQIIRDKSTAEIMTLYNVPERTARNWRTNAHRDFPTED